MNETVIVVVEYIILLADRESSKPQRQMEDP